MEMNLSYYGTCEKYGILSKAKKTYFLEPAPFQSQKSFYKKSIVAEMHDGAKILISYETPVALIQGNRLFKLQENNKYTLSQTTMKHINAFLYYNGFEKTSKTKWKIYLS